MVTTGSEHPVRAEVITDRPIRFYAGGDTARRRREIPMLRLLGLLLVIWLVITVLGAVVKGLFWLAVVGLLFFVATAALGWNKRNDPELPSRRR
jgi:hypothetical protein